MDNIDIYSDSKIILQKNNIKVVRIWIILLTSLLLMILFIPFNIYNDYIGLVKIKNNNSYIEFNVYDFPFKKTKLYISDKKYDYKLIKFEDSVAQIKVNLDSSLKVDNNYITLSFLSNRTTVFNILKNKIKKRWYYGKNK